MKNSRVWRRIDILKLTAVILLVSCAGIVFWPSSRYESKTTYFVTQDQMVPAEKAGAEALSILNEARQLSAAGALTAGRMFEMQKRMKRLSVYAEQYGPHPRPGMVFWDGASMSQLAGVRDGDPNFRGISKEEFDRYRGLFNTDPEYVQLENFKVSETNSNLPTVLLRYAQRYMLTIPLGMLVCVLLLVRKESRVGFALSVVFGHPFKMAFYPVGILWALEFMSWDDYRKGVRRLVSWLSYATAASISLVGGNASAQTVKKDGDKKKTAGYALQLDTRVTAPVEGPPPFAFNRTTLNASRWLVESITTATPETGAWYNETGLGIKVIRTSQTTVSAMGIISNDSGGTRKAMVGVQYFRTSPLATIAVPVARLEKTVDGPVSVAVAANPLFRLGRQGKMFRLALSPDVLVRKTFGKPLSWTAGAGLDWFTRKNKADRGEVALLKTSSGQWQIRGRYVVNFAF